MSDLRVAALALADRGFRVIPLRERGKVPVVDDWPNRATTDPNVIDGWWTTWPSANIGIATGPDFLVIDADGDEGEASLRALEDELGELPPSLTVRTGGGGLHVYLRLPDGATAKNRGAMAPKVDIRGDGGQVVAPPSVHHSGNVYEYLDKAPMAEIPPAWLDRIVNGDRNAAPVDFRLADGEMIPEGARNDRLFRLGASMRANGASADDVLAFLRVTNERCRPPLPEADLRTIAGSIARYEVGTPAGVIVQGSGRVTVYAPEEPDIPEALPAFPLDCLPNDARAFVEQTATSLGVQRDMVAVGALGALAAAIGGSRTLHIKDDWRESAVLWLVIVAPPGSAKTPAISRVVAPLERWESERWREFERLKADYDAAVEERRTAPKSARVEVPEEPIAKRLVVDDFTIEVLADILKENPRGVVAIQDEIAGWVMSMNQYKAGGKGGDRAKYLSMWSAKSFTVDRKTNRVSTRVKRPFFSVLGGIQPDVMGSLRERDDGFLERFLYTYQPTSHREWSEERVSESARAGWDATLNRLLKLDMTVGPFGLEPRPLTMNRDAYGLFVDACRDIYAEVDHHETAINATALISKLDTWAARLSLVLHLAAWAPYGGDIGPVDEWAVWSAVRLCDYFKRHGLAALGASASSELDRHVDQLALWGRQKPDMRASIRDIRRSGVGGIKTPDEARRLVNRLIERGLGKSEERTVRGGKTEEVTFYG